MNRISLKITGEDTVLAYNLLSKSNNYLVFITDGDNRGYDCKNTTFELFGGDLFVMFDWNGLWESESFVEFSTKNCKLRLHFTALRQREQGRQEHREHRFADFLNEHAQEQARILLEHAREIGANGTRPRRIWDIPNMGGIPNENQE